MRSKAMELWKKLSRYTQGLILIMCSALFFTWGVLGSAKVNDQTQDIIKRIEVQHIEAARDRDKLLNIIINNGEFQSCVWHEIIRPKNVGNQKRTVRAIRSCERRFLPHA